MKSEDGVDRPGPGKAPTAFRIWRAGRNELSAGPNCPDHVILDAAAVERILTAQREHGTKFPINVNHEQREGAVGWHRLAIRNGELWAVECEWAPEIKAGLEEQPPRWKYYSPEWTPFDGDMSAIGSYRATAITNVPATKQPTALASLDAPPQEKPMKLKAALASLRKAAETEGDDSAKLAAMLAALDELEPDDDEPDDAKDNELAAMRVELTEALFAARSDLSREFRASLEGLPLDKIKAVLAATPKRAGGLPGSVDHAAAAGATRAVNTLQASQLPPAEAEALRARMGLSAQQSAIRSEPGHRIFGAMTASTAAKFITEGNK